MKTPIYSTSSHAINPPLVWISTTSTIPAYLTNLGDFVGTSNLTSFT